MKAIEQSVTESADESVTIQMKATEQFLLMVLFIMLYKVILALRS